MRNNRFLLERYLEFTPMVVHRAGSRGSDAAQYESRDEEAKPEADAAIPMV
jgi:hypothetical protein